MTKDWVIEEFSDLSLGDKRLDNRAKRVLSQLSRNATESIPVSCGGAAETKAAYRLFDNAQVTPEKIQLPHLEATLSRMQEHPVVLIPQDTTTLNFSTQHQRQDVGPTTQESSKGMYLHCAIAVTPEKVCLGVVSMHQWHREKLQKLTRKERTQRNYSLPIEEKESYRWLENYKQAHDYAKKLSNTCVVSMADREGDLYDILKEAHQTFSTLTSKAHYLIRAKTDKKVCDETGKRTGDKVNAGQSSGSVNASSS